MHKLRSEIKYVPTQKNELAIKEFAEDIVQHIELEKKTPVENKSNDIIDKLDINRYIVVSVYNNRIIHCNINRIT